MGGREGRRRERFFEDEGRSGLAGAREEDMMSARIQSGWLAGGADRSSEGWDQQVQYLDSK